MSLRYTGAWMQDGKFNPLTAPTPNYNYSLWSWGYNAFGQLAQGNTFNYYSPVQIGGGLVQNVSLLDSGAYHALVLKNDGTLWSWGNNSWGELGQSEFGFTPNKLIYGL